MKPVPWVLWVPRSSRATAMVLSRVATKARSWLGPCAGILALCCLGGCHPPPRSTTPGAPPITAIAVAQETQGARRPVRLPGLAFLALGMGQREALAALRGAGYECDADSADGQARQTGAAGPMDHTGPVAPANSLVRACLAGPGSGPELATTALVLAFTTVGARLAGVQVQTQVHRHGTTAAPNDEVSRKFSALATAWRKAYGAPVEVRRPGIVANRYLLGDGTALLLVCFDAEGAQDTPAMTLEHVVLADPRSHGR